MRKFLLLISWLAAISTVAAQVPLVTKDAKIKVQQGNSTLITPVSQLLTGRVGATYNVAAYGILPNGMDCRAPLQALLDTMYNNGGGTLEFNSGTYRISGRLKPKWSNQCVGKSVPLKIVGTGAFMQGQLAYNVYAGGTILRYVGSDSIMWDLRGVGLTEFTGLTMADSTHGTVMFIRTTLNTVHVHDVAFFGDKSAFASDDIGVVLGSYKRGTIDGLCADGDTTINSGFQGYGSVIRDCFFNGISYGVWGRHNANGVHILNNTWWNSCGGTAAIRFGTNGNYNLSASALISGNLIEASWYNKPILLYNSNKAIIVENQFYDHTDTCDYDIYLDLYSTYCYVEAQFCNTDTSKILRDVSGSATVIFTEQNLASKFTQGLRVNKALTYKGISTQGPITETNSGQRFYDQYESTGISRYIEATPGVPVKLYNIRDGGSNSRVLELSGSTQNFLDSPGNMRFRATGTDIYFSTASNENILISNGTLFGGLSATANPIRLGQGDRLSWSSGSSPTNAESVGLTSTVAGTLRTVTSAGADAPHQALDFQATGTGADQLPSGTTAQAPSATNGRVRYDTDLGKLRGVVGGSWTNLLTTADVSGFISGSGSSTQVAHFNGSASITGSANFLWNNYLHLKNSNTQTSYNGTSSQDGLRLQQTDNTAGNYSMVSGYTQTNTIGAAFGFKYTDHTNGYADIPFYTRGSSTSFGLAATISSEKELLLGPASAGARLVSRGKGTTSSTYSGIFENSSGTDILTIRDDSRVGVLTASPNRTLEVAGELRVTDLTTDPPTQVAGADADGDFGALALSSELTIASGTLKLAQQGATSGQVLEWNGSAWAPATDDGGAGSGYATLRDDGVAATQRTIANFVSTATVTATLTDDAGNTETEIALSVPTDGITATQIAADAVGTSEIATDGVGTAEIAASAVGTSEIADGSILQDDLNQMSATTGQALTWNGSTWQPQTPAYPGGNGHPTDLSADVNDYSPTNWATVSTHFLSGSGGIWTITGLDDLAGGTERTLVNDGNVPFVVASQHTGSAAANRVKGVGDYMVSPGGSITFVYSDGNSRWLVKNTSFAPDQLGRQSLGQYFYQSPGSTNQSDHPFLGFATSGTSAGNANIAPASGRPSSWELTTGTTGTGVATIYLPKNNANFTTLGDGHVVAQATFWVPTLSNGTQTYTLQFGLVPTATSTTLAVNNMAVIRYTHSVNSGKFEFVTRNNAGSETATDVGVTVATNTPYTATIVMNKARTEARCYLSTNGAQPVMVANTATMPNAVAVGVRGGMFASAGTTTKPGNFSLISGWVHQ